LENKKKTSKLNGNLSDLQRDCGRGVKNMRYSGSFYTVGLQARLVALYSCYRASLQISF